MSRIQELGSFKDHLYDMLVAMMFRSNARVEGKEEDIHGGRECLSFGPNQSILAPIECRQNRKGHDIRILGNRQDQHEDIRNPHTVSPWRQPPIACQQGNRTKTENPSPICVRISHHHLDVTFQENQHGAKFVALKIEEVVGVHFRESIVYEELAQDIPSLLDALFVDGAFGRQRNPVALKVSPNIAETSACFIGEGNFGVGIHGIVGLNRPSP